MKDVETQLLRGVDDRQSELVELVRELVRIDTVNPYSGEDTGGDEAEGQAAVVQHLRRLGAEVREFEPMPDTYERAGVIGPRGRSWAGRPNVVGEWVFGDGGAGPSVIVVGHIDTVGVQGMDDPFGANVKDGAVWGRGASDDKGGLAVGLAAVEALLARSSDLCGRLTYLSVVDEECNGSGAGIIACALEGIKADSAVSLDGAGLEIVRGCNGCLTAEIVVDGVAGHGALGNGVNAIEKAIPIAQAVLEFGEERHGHLPGCLLNLGTFRAGTLPPVIPDRASMGMNIVYDIEEAREAEERTGVWGGRLVWDALNGAVRRAESDDEWLREHPSSIEWVKDLVPYEVEESDRVVAGMASAARDVIGREPTVSKMVAWTDSCWLHVLSDTPVVVFGPGDAETIHGPNEHVQIDDLIASAKALALYLYRELRTFG